MQLGNTAGVLFARSANRTFLDNGQVWTSDKRENTLLL